MERRRTRREMRSRGRRPGWSQAESRPACIKVFAHSAATSGQNFHAAISGNRHGTEAPSRRCLKQPLGPIISTLLSLSQRPSQWRAAAQRGLANPARQRSSRPLMLMRSGRKRAATLDEPAKLDAVCHNRARLRGDSKSSLCHTNPTDGRGSAVVGRTSGSNPSPRSAPPHDRRRW